MPFPVNSLFLRMRGIPGEPSKGAWDGFSHRQAGEKPIAITLFPVDFSDTGNFGREGLAEDLGPPPTTRVGIFSNKVRNDL